MPKVPEKIKRPTILEQRVEAIEKAIEELGNRLANKLPDIETGGTQVVNHEPMVTKQASSVSSITEEDDNGTGN